MKAVLESDGTEVDEEEVFEALLEIPGIPTFMLLTADQHWQREDALVIQEQVIPVTTEPETPMGAVSNQSVVTVTTGPKTLTASMAAVSDLSVGPKTGDVENKEAAPATISRECSMTCEYLMQHGHTISFKYANTN